MVKKESAMHGRASNRVEVFMKHCCRAAWVFVLLFLGCAGGEYIPSVWEGSGRGYRGEIRVQVSAGAALIQGIEISAHREDPLIGGAAMEELLELVLEYQTTDLDGISGATESCAGFLAAVEDALNRTRPDQGAE
jgi:uncharacterized protein with FMN-binding domain